MRIEVGLSGLKGLMKNRLMLNKFSTLIPMGVLVESMIPTNEIVSTMVSAIVMAVDEHIGEGRWFC